MYYHAIAILSGDRRKSIVNKSEESMLTEVVIPYVNNGVVKLKWGSETRSYQVIDLRIYKTDAPWYKKSGVSLDDLLARKRNIFAKFERKAKDAMTVEAHRVFVIMPIQGEKYGTQDEQRIFREYDERFETIETLLGDYDCVGIRIDKEHPLDDMVRRIKEEIRRSKFVIADLTDERQSCYFEVGYAEALGRPIIYCASKESVLSPGSQTKIHFDIHMNVNMFTNHKELDAKLRSAIDKNRSRLFPKPSSLNKSFKEYLEAFTALRLDK